MYCDFPDDVILIDDTMYSLIEDEQQIVTNLHQIFLTIWSLGIS